jgi:hypothetical protein
MPEALEKWPVKVMTKMLPRHMEIIEIINTGWIAYLETALAALPEDERVAKIDAMSIIHENQWNKDELWVARLEGRACAGAGGGDGGRGSRALSPGCSMQRVARAGRAGPLPTPAASQADQHGVPGRGGLQGRQRRGRHPLGDRQGGDLQRLLPGGAARLALALG